MTGRQVGRTKMISILFKKRIQIHFLKLEDILSTENSLATPTCPNFINQANIFNRRYFLFVFPTL